MAETNPRPITDAPLPPDAPGSILDAKGNFKEEQPPGTVRFTGTRLATTRIIRPSEWPLGTPKLDSTVTWDLGNSYTVKKELFQKEHLEILEADPNFSVS